jgi:PAS domain S-box-containing protein
MASTKVFGKESSNLLQKILDTTQTMIFWKDAQRRFVGVNQAFLDYYGFAGPEVLLGKTDEEMGWHSDPGPFEDDEWQVLRQGKSFSMVHGKCMARGEEREIMASKSPLYEQGKIVGLVGSLSM